jgi:putative membrane protein (TIGR04086 family)
MINKRQTAKNIINEHSNIVNITKGIMISYIITIPVFAVFAYFLTLVDFAEDYMPAVVIITTLVSIIFAGWSAASNIRDRGWLNGGIIGFVYMLVLFLLSNIVFRDFVINRHVITMFIIGIITGSIGGIFGINLKKQPRIKTRS